MAIVERPLHILAFPGASFSDAFEITRGGRGFSRFPSLPPSTPRMNYLHTRNSKHAPSGVSKCDKMFVAS